MTSLLKGLSKVPRLNVLVLAKGGEGGISKRFRRNVICSGRCRPKRHLQKTYRRFLGPVPFGPEVYIYRKPVVLPELNPLDEFSCVPATIHMEAPETGIRVRRVFFVGRLLSVRN